MNTPACELAIIGLITCSNSRTIPWMVTRQSARIVFSLHSNNPSLPLADPFGDVYFHKETLRADEFDVSRTRLACIPTQKAFGAPLAPCKFFRTYANQPLQISIEIFSFCSLWQ
jgi:hypothetical protein